VNEPTAAALARAWAAIRPETSSILDSGATGGQKSLVLVYDYGGGTFDVTVLERTGNECRVLASRGDGHLGGADLDRELRVLASRFFKTQGLDLDSDRFLAQELAGAAERAKIELSEREEASIALAFAASGGKIIHPVFELSRSQFEDIARPCVERSIELVEKALLDASVSKEELGSLVLSGGSSRIPLVRRMLKEKLGLEPEGGVNPEEIVALGAAVSAALTLGEGRSGARMRVLDVVSRSYGVEIDGGAFIPLVRKNCPVPSSYSRVFTTVSDDQDSVEIHVLQGESKLASEDLSLGKFLLAGIRPAKAGLPRIKVDFSIDESDMLHVSAIDLGSGAEQAISIADIGRGASDESSEVLARKTSLLVDRIAELRSDLKLERGLESELDDAILRARRVQDSSSKGAEGEIRMLKAELEGLVGELLARRSEARSDERRAAGRTATRGLGETA
jgi:molecular chaperone DnaK